MWNQFWPVAMIVASNIAYNLLTRATPEGVNPYFSLVGTYLISAIAAAGLYLLTAGGSTAAEELRRMNWTSWALGLALVGLETGYIYLYRAGWKLSLGSLVANITLAVILLLIGLLVFRETVTLRQWAGMALCVGGLLLMNL